MSPLAKPHHLAVLSLLALILLAPGTAGAHPEEGDILRAMEDPVFAAEMEARLAADPLAVAVDYLGFGIGHILPGGLDHILFVLALCVAAPRLRALVIQITTFTVAHSTTLALAALDLVAVSAEIVEPLIAASIAWVAVENLGRRSAPGWRPVVVFVFGLLHGLGFAGALAELGLPTGALVTSLVGFNVGVELGQLAIVVVAWSVLRFVRESPRYRAAVVIPVSGAIGLAGVAWTLQRLLVWA